MSGDPMSWSDVYSSHCARGEDQSSAAAAADEWERRRKPRPAAAVAELERTADRMCRAMANAHTLPAIEDAGLLVNSAWVDLQNALKRYRREAKP